MAAVFGALIGWLKVSTRHMPAATVLLPVAAATLVSLLAFWIKPDQTIDGSMRVLIPALVTFLPGGLLTTATLDLAAGETISGSSRLVARTMQLVLLSFGIVAGAELAGVSLDEAITNRSRTRSATGRRSSASLVFGVGAYLHFSGPRRSLGWLILVLAAGYAGQQLGGRIVSDDVAGFFGGLVLTPVGRGSRRARQGRRSWRLSCPRSGCSCPAPSG